MPLFLTKYLLKIFNFCYRVILPIFANGRASIQVILKTHKKRFHIIFHFFLPFLITEENKLILRREWPVSVAVLQIFDENEQRLDNSP